MWGKSVPVFLTVKLTILPVLRGNFPFCSARQSRRRLPSPGTHPLWLIPQIILSDAQDTFASHTSTFTPFSYTKTIHHTCTPLANTHSPLIHRKTPISPPLSSTHSDTQCLWLRLLRTCGDLWPWDDPCCLGYTGLLGLAEWRSNRTRHRTQRGVALATLRYHPISGPYQNH